MWLWRVSWGPRRVGGIVQPKCKGLRTRVVDGVGPSLGTDKDEMR
jgi:hypothetical protein